MAIDWEFLKETEVRKDKDGNFLREDTTYIPKKNGKPIQNSGVTIGVGIDLGQQSEDQLRADGVPETVINKLKPFLGKSPNKGDDVVRLLDEHGTVTLTEEELDSLERPVKMRHVRQIKNWYNDNNTLGQDWGDLTDKQQTIILSVHWNHGETALTSYNFGKQVAEGRWDDVADNLRNFYSSEDNDLHSRRIKELQYLVGADVDGIAGDQTDAKLKEFKENFSITTPDAPTPPSPQLPPMGFTENFMAMFEEILNRRQSPSQEVSEPVTADTEERLGESEDAAAERGGVSQFTEAEEALISVAVSTPMEDKPAEEEVEWTLAEQNLLERATGTVETAPPVYAETREGGDDSKDPIYGIF